jgi:hypothetical protein
MPVWDKVCPECGAKQPELMAAKANRLAEGKATAERDLANHDFRAAAAIAESLSQITDIRFADFQEWGRAFGARVSTAKSAADEMVAARTGEARTHQASYDYAAAIQALESLPHQQLVGHVAAHLQELRERLGESTQLLRTIKTRIANSELDGLLSLASRAAELLGDRADLRTLVARLEKRESRLRDQISTAFADARRLFEAGDAKSATPHMAPFRMGLEPEQMQFKELVQRAVEEEEKLLKLLASAKADGTITPDEVVMLADQVVQCLKLNPNHPRIHALRQQLVNRIDKTPTDFAEKAEALMPLVASLGGVSAVPDSFRRMLYEHDLWSSRHGLTSVRRERLKEYVRMHSGSDLVRCPICQVELKASNVVLHYDRQHAT